MAEAPSAPVAFGPEQMALSTELLQALTAGDKVRLVELLNREGRTANHVVINVNDAGAPPGAVSPPRVGTSGCCLMGVTSNGNTALHLVASRGHAELAALICEEAPSLVAARNRCLDTPLHCAARGGHREVAACLLSAMRAAGGADEAAALRATNRLGDTALHEAVRHGRAGVVDVIMAEAPELASVTSDDGVSPLYLAVTTNSRPIVRLLLRPSPDGTPSPASAAGRNGRTALHVAAAISKEMVEHILAWEPEGPTLLTRVDSSGRSPLHFAVEQHKLDVAKLLLHVNSSLARISDNEGSFPLHLAAIVGCTSMIDELTKRCPDDCYELVDHDGMNLLHVAVVRNMTRVVQYICQDDSRFTILLNATDVEGNTPLHLAVKYGYKQIAAILLQNMSVEMNIHNKDGLTARDLAYIEMRYQPTRYFLNHAIVVFYCLRWAGAVGSLDIIDINQTGSVSTKDKSKEGGYTKGSRTIVSGLIATVTFAAAFTVPGGFIADDGHRDRPGTALLARRFAFRAFVVSDTVAFLFSIIATCLLIYGGAMEVPRSHQRLYNRLASGLVPLAVQFMIAAFAFGFHLVLGAANHGLIIFVYMVSSASVLLCFPGIWVPFCLGFGTAIWRRAGWRGILRPLVEVRRTLCAVLICVTFVVAIAHEIASPNY